MDRTAPICQDAGAIPCSAGDGVPRGTLCVACRERPRKPKQRYCKDCHRLYMKSWRAQQREELLRLRKLATNGASQEATPKVSASGVHVRRQDVQVRADAQDDEDQGFACAPI
jgi:hypothetical protein